MVSLACKYKLFLDFHTPLRQPKKILTSKLKYSTVWYKELSCDVIQTLLTSLH